MKPTFILYRGYTHGEFEMLPDAPCGRWVGNWIRRNLQEHEWDPKFKRWIEKENSMYAFYDRATCRLHVPISFCDDIISIFRQCYAEVIEQKLPDYPLRKIDIKMNPSFQDQPHQVNLIAKCSEPIPGMKGLAMQTGKGKTYSAIKSAINLGYAVMVIVDGLVDQWIDDGASSFLNCTNATKDDVYRLQGFESIARLTEFPITYKPSIFVASLTTMQQYATKSDRGGYDMLSVSYKEFFEKFGIGTKIVDECHLNFHANVHMDLLTNVPYNLYCSATFGQSSKETRRIFDKVFPESIRYGTAEYDKYVTTYFYNFSGEVQERRCVRARGYMHVRYEADIMKSDRKLNSHIEQQFVPVINQHFVRFYKPGYKMLIFCSSIEFVRAVVDKLTEKYPEFKIQEYIAGSDTDVLKSADIIVSTTGKAGTGLDIKNLICAYNTVSMKTPILTQQMIGRLRKMSNVELTYVDRCDTNLRSQCRHADERKCVLRSISKNFYEFNGYQDTTVYVDPTNPSPLRNVY